MLWIMNMILTKLKKAPFKLLHICDLNFLQLSVPSGNGFYLKGERGNLF